MDALNGRLCAIEQPPVFEMHLLLKAVDLSQQVSRVDLRSLEPFRAPARVLACRTKRVKGQSNRLFYLGGCCGHLIVSSLFVSSAGILADGCCVLEGEAGAPL